MSYGEVNIRLIVINTGLELSDQLGKIAASLNKLVIQTRLPLSVENLEQASDRNTHNRGVEVARRDKKLKFILSVHISIDLSIRVSQRQIIKLEA